MWKWNIEGSKNPLLDSMGWCNDSADPEYEAIYPDVYSMETSPST